MTRGWVLFPIAALLGSWAVAQEEDKKSEPKETGVVELAGTRLVQIEVNLRGPKDTLDSLTRDDFRLSIGRRRVQEFEVDKLCRDPDQSRSLEKVADETGSPAEGTPALVLGPTTFLFYFDQQHLTMAGRQTSIDILETMIPELIQNGNRGSIVSNGRNLETLAELTTDPEVLLTALEEMEGDFDHFDEDAQLEGDRVSEVLELMSINYEDAAMLVFP